MMSFCTICGRGGSPENPIVGGLCVECFANTRRVVQLPEHIEITRCPLCGSIRSYKGRFHRTTLDSYVRDIVEEYIAKGKVAEGLNEVRIVDTMIHESNALVRVRAVVGRAFFDQVLRVRLSIRDVVCPTCFKYRTKSYEAVIQLRPGNPRASAILPEIVRKIQEYPGIIDLKEVDRGVDVYVIDKSTATRIVKEIETNYVTRVLSSWEGSKYGHRKPKSVFSVKVYDIVRGDVVELQDGLYEVIEYSPRVVVLRNLRSGRTSNISLSNLLRQSPNFLEKI